MLRGVAESGRAAEIALYSGNDDHIVLDLVTTFHGLRMVGGLLGQWAVWTRRAVATLEAIHRNPDAPEWLETAARLTDANGAIFDVANGFRGSIAGVHEVLRRQGLLDGIWCLGRVSGVDGPINKLHHRAISCTARHRFRVSFGCGQRHRRGVAISDAV